MEASSGSTAAALDDSAQHSRGLLLVTVATLIWSSGGLIVRVLDTDPWTTILWRSTFATLFLVVYIALRERGRTLAVFLQMGRAGLLIAACFAAASIGMVVAISLTTVANTLIILSVSPLMAAAVGWAALGERPSRSSWLAMVAASCGVALMVSDDTGSHGAIAGDLIALAIAGALAVGLVTIRRHREVRMTPATCLATLLAAAIALPLASPTAASAGDFSLLIFFGAGQLGLGLALFTSGARLAPAAQVALIGLLEPILGPVWVWLFLGEALSRSALFGAGIVIASLIAHTLHDRRRQRAVPPAI